jgi:FMN phosphatase YigB (HAD superfamily)
VRAEGQGDEVREEKVQVKVIAFDLFGTVFDLSGVSRDDVRAYVSHIHKPEWEPLTLPESWASLPMYPDAVEGLAKLRGMFEHVITLSNAPTILQVRLGVPIHFTGICALDKHKVYKPKPRAYMAALVEWMVDPADCLMVTANAKFGDIEAARLLGMKSQLIRNPGCPQTIIELAEKLEACR